MPLTKLSEYKELEKEIASLKEDDRLDIEHQLVRTDLFYLMRYVLSCRLWKAADGTPAPHNEWVLDRCREVEQGGHDILRIWSRFHWKSTCETFANTIRELLINPEETICIFSHTRPLAKKFLDQIRFELEENEHLKRLSWNDEAGRYSFYQDPKKESRLWSLNEGIVINRQSNPKNASVEASGLVDSQPVGARYTLMKYDDVVTPASVTTPAMIEKTTQAWRYSLNLGIPGITRRRYIGTYYAYGDTYQQMERAGVEVQVRTAYEIVSEVVDEHSGIVVDIDFDFDKPTYMGKDVLEEERQKMGEEVFATQILCFPFVNRTAGFKREWLKYSDIEQRYQVEDYIQEHNLVLYSLTDPANSKDSGSSETVTWIVGLRHDGTYHLLDGLWDQLDLEERTKAIFAFNRRYKIRQNRYERYSFQADIDHMKYVQKVRREFFNMTPVGGIVQKPDRIARLIPLFKEGRFYLPKKITYTRVDGTETDLVQRFLNEEYMKFPTSTSNDALDALSRIVDPDNPLVWPREATETKARYKRQPPKSRSWMSI